MGERKYKMVLGEDGKRHRVYIDIEEENNTEPFTDYGLDAFEDLPKTLYCPQGQHETVATNKSVIEETPTATSISREQSEKKINQLYNKIHTPQGTIDFEEAVKNKTVVLGDEENEIEATIQLDTKPIHTSGYIRIIDDEKEQIQPIGVTTTNVKDSDYVTLNQKELKTYDVKELQERLNKKQINALQGIIIGILTVISILVVGIGIAWLLGSLL